SRAPHQLRRFEQALSGALGWGRAWSDRRTIARFEMFLDHVVDHPVAGAAVTAGAAVLRHHFTRGRSRFDGRPDFGLRDGEAHANVHAVQKIMKTTFKC